MEKSVAVIVLGPHRSGTSLVAGMLQAMGVDMGSSMREPDEMNPTGYCEDLNFKWMNQRILKMAGGTWWNLPLEHNIYMAGISLAAEIKDLVWSRSKSKLLWGWKDPRQTYTMPCYWRWLVGADVRLVCMFRDLGAIATSLFKREQIRQRRTHFDVGYWLDVSVYYRNSVMSWLDNTYRTAFPYQAMKIHYEDIIHSPESAWQEALKLAQFVGLTVEDEDPRLLQAVKLVRFKNAEL